MLTAKWNWNPEISYKKSTGRDKQDKENSEEERRLMICSLFPVCYIMCYQNG